VTLEEEAYPVKLAEADVPVTLEEEAYPVKLVSISLSRVFKKKEKRLIGRKSFGLVWEGLPAFGCQQGSRGRWLPARVGKYLVSVVRTHLGLRA